MNRKYSEVKEDYYRLKELCNNQDVPDYCGAWCSNHHMTLLLDNPSKRTAASLFSSLIDRYYSCGHEQDLDSEGNKPINLMNSEIHEILVRNGNL